MTELQQKHYEELMQQLQQEESCCENCGSWKEYGDAGCEGCRTYENKRMLEEMIAEMIL